MPYLGSWKIDDYLTFVCNTHAITGPATDADSVPTYRVYEDETGTPLLTGSTAKLDDANTTGFYSERIQLTAANGFEKGKAYTIYITATVGGTAGTVSHTFQIEAEVDANRINAAAVIESVTGAVGSVTSSVMLAAGQTSGYTLAAGQAPTSGITLAGGQTSGYTLAAGQASTSGITLAGGQTSGYSLIGGIAFTTAQTADAVIRQMVTASAGAYASAHAYSVVKQTADNAGGSALTTAAIATGIWQWAGAVGRTLTADALTSATFADRAITSAIFASTSTIKRAVWLNATRTLTQTGASVAAAVAGSDLTITKYVDYDATLTSLGDLSNRSRLWLTMKDNLNQDADTDAILKVEITSGALYINKAAATSASYSSLGVTSDGTTWNVVLFVDADATGLMGAGRTIEYDVKMRTSTGAISQVTAGKAHVQDTATRATT